MNKTINVSLNNSDLDLIIKKLEQLNKDIQTLPDLLTKEIAYDGLEQLDNFYITTPYQANSESVNTEVVKKENGYSIIGSGSTILYDEYGTGDEGASNAHPFKNQTGIKLNPYNSGKTIRPANETSAEHGITSGLYWTYKKDGYVYYTQGIPAGKQFFNTRNYILNKGIKKAKDKVVGDILSKL